MEALGHPAPITCRKEAEDGLLVGNRLMAAGEHELALEAFYPGRPRPGASLPEVLSGHGQSAKLGLRRLGQAEELLRQRHQVRARILVWPEPMNNLGAWC